MAITTISRGDISAGEQHQFSKHACPPVFEGGPVDPQRPTLSISRSLPVPFVLPLPPGTLADQDSLPMWIIEDPEDSETGKTFPSKAIRARQGDVVHVRVVSRTGTQTIHWHGIEPSPLNDGAGRHSFEISNHFVYQFATSQAGTYFYHAGKNAPLLVEMGLYGLLIVDPPEGPGFAAAYNPPEHIVPYDVEAFWVADEMSSRWHNGLQNSTTAFMQKCDGDNPAGESTFTHNGFLHDFKPDVFVISGVASTGEPILDPRAAVSAQAGQTILARMLNAGYLLQRFTLGLDARVIAFDGRPLGVPPQQAYSRPFTLPAGKPLVMAPGRRADLLIRPKSTGTFPVRVDFLQDVTGRGLHTAQTVITIE